MMPMGQEPSKVGKYSEEISPEYRGPECPICARLKELRCQKDTARKSQDIIEAERGISLLDSSHPKCKRCGLRFGYDHLVHDEGGGVCNWCHDEQARQQRREERREELGG